jgi:hypothetical protein
MREGDCETNPSAIIYSKAMTLAIELCQLLGRKPLPHILYQGTNGMKWMGTCRKSNLLVQESRLDLSAFLKDRQQTPDTLLSPLPWPMQTPKINHCILWHRAGM